MDDRRGLGGPALVVGALEGPGDVAVAVPVEQRSDVVVVAGDEPVQGDHSAHDCLAHELILSLADFMQSHYRELAAVVIGRRLFDLTNGWNGKPAAGEHVFVVTHRPPTDWEHADTAPFTFVDGVEKAIATAKEFAGDRLVDVAAGQIGSQALELGLIDQVVVNQVPVVFGSGRPFFATGSLAEPLRLENPTTIVPGDRVTHLVYDVSR
jgi:dihydrofolate reductase